jgi:hypothetical protein
VTTSYCFGQNLILDIINPLPRANDAIEVGISVGPAVNGESNKTLLGTIKVEGVPFDNDSISIGPFIFMLNGKSFKSNQLSLKVENELPRDITDGLWVSSIKFNFKRYLIIEQRIPTKISKVKNSENELQINKGSDAFLFAELDEEALEDKGVSIVSINTMSGKKIVNLDDPYGSFTHQTTIYCYELTTAYNETFKITKSYLINLPGEIEVKEVWIK